MSLAINKKKIYSLLLVLFISATALSCGKPAESTANTEPRKPLPEYTAQNPREWDAYAQSHLPHGRLSLNGDRKISVYLEPALEKEHAFGAGHYIEKLGIMDKSGRVLALKEFSPNHRGPYSAEFTVPAGLLNDHKLFSRCNLHDLWSATFVPGRD